MVEINKQFIKKELQILFDNVSDRIIDNLYDTYDIEKLYDDLSKDNDIKLHVRVSINDSGYNNINEDAIDQDWYNKYQIFSSVPTEQKQKEEDDCPELIPVPAPTNNKQKKETIQLSRLEIQMIIDFLHTLSGYQLINNNYQVSNVLDLVRKLQDLIK